MIFCREEINSYKNIVWSILIYLGNTVRIQGGMYKWSPFWIIDFAYAHNLFQILSTVQQTKVSQAFSVNKSAPWCNSLLQKFGKGMLYYLTFILEALIKMISECLGVNLRTDSYSYWYKPNTLLSCCLRWSEAKVTLCLHSSSHMISDSTQRPTISVWRS